MNYDVNEIEGLGTVELMKTKSKNENAEINFTKMILLTFHLSVSTGSILKEQPCPWIKHFVKILSVVSFLPPMSNPRTENEYASKEFSLQVEMGRNLRQRSYKSACTRSFVTKPASKREKCC